MSYTHLPKICLLTALVLATPAMAAVITWDTSSYQVVAGAEGQVSTDGDLLTAVAFSSSSNVGNLGPQTINGVTFDCDTLTFNTAGTPGVPHAVSDNASLSFQSGGYNGNQGDAYLNLLSTGIYLPDNYGAQSPIILSGLTDGQTYLVQLWGSYWSSSNDVRFSDVAPTYDSGSNSWHSTNESATVNSGVNGGVTPQYTFGTFTASGTTQNIYWYGDVNNYGIFGAFQVRAVPEPTTVALLAFGGFAWFLRSRFRSRSALAA